MGIKTLTRIGKWQTPMKPYRGGEFAMWMGYITPGMITRGNLDLLNYAVKHMPETGAVVEIGSFAGLSLNYILQMRRQHGRKNPVFSSDPWAFENRGANDDTIPGSNVTFGAYRAHVIETFRKNITVFHGDALPHHVQAYSDEFFDMWRDNREVTDFFGHNVKLGGPIAMAYIDGNHTHEESAKDFKNVDKWLAPGGFVIFDDSADDSNWGSKLTAQVATRRDDYELIEKNPNYCIRKRS